MRVPVQWTGSAWLLWLVALGLAGLFAWLDYRSQGSANSAGTEAPPETSEPASETVEFEILTDEPE
ncbi:MAG: hypothetical protein AAGF12_35115 [Myxococcota bacterium]